MAPVVSPSFVRRGEGAVEAFAYSPLSSCCHPRCLSSTFVIEDLNRGSRGFVFFCYSERSEESHRRGSTHSLYLLNAWFRTAQVIAL